MEIEIKRAVKVQVKSLKVEAGVRYWEDAEVNGISDESGGAIPCRVGDNWCPVIDLETGVIHDWPENTLAKIHYKVCDAGRFSLIDEAGEEVISIDGYVPSILSPGGSGYGDYIIMNVGPTGTIENWDGTDLDAFSEDESA